jgi:hypothetical protein
VLRGRSFLALVAATAVVVVIAAITLEREPARPQVGELLFPALLDQVNEIVEVEVTAAGNSFTLVREGNTWNAPSRDGYPLEPDKVHRLLVGAATLERLEPKTADPARFAELGLGEPDGEQARSVRFVLRSAGGGQRAALLVGERRPAKGDPSRTEYFVRAAGDERSWLVRGNLPADAGEVVDWLDQRIVAIPTEQVARVRVAHADGETVTVVKGEATDVSSFDYQEKPPGEAVEETWRVNELGRLLADLSLEDVRPASEAAGEPELTARVEAYGGLRVIVRLYGAGEDTLAILEAGVEPPAAEPPPATPAPEAVREEAGRLNGRWAPWAYVLPRWKVDALRYRQADLVEPAKETGAAPPARGG